MYYAGNATTFSAASSPNSAYYNGTASGVSISGVSAPSTNMTATVSQGGVNAPASAPIIGTAVAGNGSISVSFTPGSLGSGSLVNHTASCGGVTANGMVSPIAVGGLSNGTTYTCKVNTTTTVGVSAWSANSNSVTPTVPIPPSAPSDTQAAAGNTSVSVSFTPGAMGSGTFVNHTVNCGGIVGTGSASPITVTGLTNGATYTCKVATTTSVAMSGWSADSNAFVPGSSPVNMPLPPTIGAVMAGDGLIRVTFTPGWLGSGTLTSYTAECGGITATGSASPIIVTGLTNGTSYTCKAKATTTAGSSAWSASSSSVTPVAGPASPTNVALAANGGVASASSVLGSYYASYINDNERAGYAGGKITSWVDGSQNVFPDWAQVTFNSIHTINSVVLYTLQNNLTTPIEPTDALTFTLYGATSYTVQTWDGAAWITQATVTGNNLVKRTVTFAPVATDRVRIYVNSSPNGYSYITELEAWTH